MKKLFLAVLISLPLLASNLSLQDGFVAAHTQMLMDSTIDPLNNHLHADLSMTDNDLTTLRGKLWIQLDLLSSDNTDRDKHMYEAMDVQKYPLASYIISRVTKVDNTNYTIEGTLNFFGQDRPLSLTSEITQNDGTITISATSKFLVSDFGMEMPCMMFMCVRDEVDIFAKAVLTK